MRRVTDIACLAHGDAVDDAEIMHRDISVGNTLICPTISYDEETKTYEIIWKGMLSDWEVAKSKNSDLGARQPERTVCLLRSSYSAHESLIFSLLRIGYMAVCFTQLSR